MRVSQWVGVAVGVKILDDVSSPTVSPIILRLREVRNERGLSQRELAELAGVRQATISLMETAGVRRLDLEVLERLAKALEVRATELLLEVRRSRHSLRRS